MPWMECDQMCLRREFVELACVEGANVSALCRRFGISRKTGCKWLKRYRDEGPPGLHHRSRRPCAARCPTPAAMEKLVLDVREKHPFWGGRKIRRVLLNRGHGDDQAKVPAASTITGILHRHDLIHPEESLKHSAYQRFERSEPNELWQMDYKGEFQMGNGKLCHPLTVTDDPSRFNLRLRACANQKRLTVQEQLTDAFRRYGLPQRILADNGPPWGSPRTCRSEGRSWTQLEVWLLRLGIAVSHGRPYPPQTQGKEERFHRTLKLELLQHGRFDDLAHTQQQFDAWRAVYNHERPHEALDLAVPSSRYRISERAYPETLPALEYSLRHEVRKVDAKGALSFQGRSVRISDAFIGLPLGLRSRLTEEGVWDVYFASHSLGVIDLREAATPGSSAVVRLPTCVRDAHYGGQHHDDLS